MFEDILDPKLILSVSLLVVPIYIANGMAPLFAGGKPIDFGRNFIDKKRIFGDGKTFNGTFGGILCATLAGLIEAIITAFFVEGAEFPPFYILLGFTAGSGAMIGDLIGAFIKRRLGLPRGAPAPILDQLDFIIIAILFASFLIKITPSMIFIVILITPFIHILVNGIAYKLGKKKEPW